MRRENVYDFSRLAPGAPFCTDVSMVPSAESCRCVGRANEHGMSARGRATRTPALSLQTRVKSATTTTIINMTTADPENNDESPVDNENNVEEGQDEEDDDDDVRGGGGDNDGGDATKKKRKKNKKKRKKKTTGTNGVEDSAARTTSDAAVGGIKIQVPSQSHLIGDLKKQPLRMPMSSMDRRQFLRFLWKHSFRANRWPIPLVKSNRIHWPPNRIEKRTLKSEPEIE